MTHGTQDLRLTGMRTPRECTDELDRWLSHQPWSFTGRKKQKQVQCQACRRWKYADERCNLFTRMKP